MPNRICAGWNLQTGSRVINCFRLEERPALHTVTLRRSDSATEILVAPAGDEDPHNRRRALQGLWIAATDGFDVQGQAQLALEDALQDPDCPDPHKPIQYLC